MSCCCGVFDISVIALAEHCSNLTDLNFNFCRNITDASLITLAEHCPNLTALNIGCCQNITAAALIALGSHSRCLRSLNICDNKNLTVDGVRALAVGCPLLHEVNAYDSSFDSACVIALVSECHDLRKLDVGWCYNIGLSAISALARSCPLITELYLSYTNVDDASLLSIAQHSRSLTSLDIRNSKDLRKRSGLMMFWCHSLRLALWSISLYIEWSRELWMRLSEFVRV